MSTVLEKAVEKARDRIVQNGYEGVIGDDYYKGVGVAYDPSWTLEETLKHADLDWRVDTDDIRYGNWKNPKEKVIYRKDTGTKFGLCSPRWTPYQNVDLVYALRTFCETAGIKIERLGHLRGGNLIFASAIVNNSWAVMGSKDVVAARLLLTNSHEWGVGLKAKIIAIRLVCTNGMTKQHCMGTQTIRHNCNFDESMVYEILENSQRNFLQIGEYIDTLTSINVSNSDAKSILVETLGDREDGNLKSFNDQSRLVRHAYYSFANHTSVGADLDVSHGNAWELVNCVTEQINHYCRSKGEKHMNSLWNGNKAVIQNRLLSALEFEQQKRLNKNNAAQIVSVHAFN